MNGGSQLKLNKKAKKLKNNEKIVDFYLTFCYSNRANLC